MIRGFQGNDYNSPELDTFCITEILEKYDESSSIDAYGEIGHIWRILIKPVTNPPEGEHVTRESYYMRIKGTRIWLMQRTGKYYEDEDDRFIRGYNKDLYPILIGMDFTKIESFIFVHNYCSRLLRENMGYTKPAKKSL